nr:tetratricopeptide repeat protein [Luteimonas galliterrae]
MFELLTGRKPFSDPLAPREPPQASRVATDAGANTGERAAARAATPHTLRKTLRGDIDRILRAALDPDPTHRYRSAARFGEDLRAVVAGRAISLRRDRTYRVRVFLRRHRLGAVAASLAALGLMATTGWALWQTQLATERAETAKREALAAESISELLISSFAATDPTQSDKAGVEPTARDVLNTGAAKASEKLAQTPAVLGRVRLMLGQTYLNLGDNDKAAELLTAAAKGYAHPSVNQPEKTAEAIAMLAQVEQNRGNDAKAVELSRRVLAIHQKLGRQEDIAISYNTLGMTLISALRYDEADQALQSAQNMAFFIYGNPSKQLARVLHNRAALANSAGRYSQAERWAREALEMKAKLKATQSAFFTSRTQLAMAIAKQGRLTEAEAALGKNLELAPVVYPDDDVRLARATQRLAMVHHERGDLVRAQQGYEQAIAANERQNLREAATAHAYRMLAEVLELRGDIAGAARAYRSAEERMAEQDGASHRLEKWQAIASHGVFLTRHGKSGIPRDRTEQALTEWIAMFGPQPATAIPEDLAAARLLLAEYRLLQGDPQGAQTALFADAAAAEQPLLQARRRYWQARIHTMRGESAAALVEYARAIEQAEAVAGAGTAHAALWRLDYIEQLAKTGHAAEARKQYAAARPALVAQLMPAAPPMARMKALAEAIAAGNDRFRQVAATSL